MMTGVLFLIITSVFAHIDVKPSSSTLLPRMKRGASGALHIVTNHAQPIHADVKSETPSDNAEKTVSEQPCRKGSGPAHIEPGVGFKVTPPEDRLTTFDEQKSLRKSLPGTSSILTLIRSINRVGTLIVLFVSAVLEFYPTIHNLISNIFNFMNTK